MWCSADVTIMRTRPSAAVRAETRAEPKMLRVLSHVRTPPAAAVSACVRARQK